MLRGSNEVAIPRRRVAVRVAGSAHSGQLGPRPWSAGAEKGCTLRRGAREAWNSDAVRLFARVATEGSPPGTAILPGMRRGMNRPAHPLKRRASEGAWARRSPDAGGRPRAADTRMMIPLRPRSPEPTRLGNRKGTGMHGVASGARVRRPGRGGEPGATPHPRLGAVLLHAVAAPASDSPRRGPSFGGW
jgi:hypothetical protein